MNHHYKLPYGWSSYITQLPRTVALSVVLLQDILTEEWTHRLYSAMKL